jgi:hypothetical protein
MQFERLPGDGDKFKDALQMHKFERKMLTTENQLFILCRVD